MDDAFADTSGWAEYLVLANPFHALAVEWMDLWQAVEARVVTTNYVLAVLIPLLSARSWLARSYRDRLIDDIRSSPRVEIVHITPELDRAAWELLKRHADKDWSLVDCASFVVMRDRGITAALSTDHHFAQAGFERLLA